MVLHHGRSLKIAVETQNVQLLRHSSTHRKCLFLRFTQDSQTNNPLGSLELFTTIPVRSVHSLELTLFSGDLF